MAKRYDPRAIKIHHSYTVEEAAKVLKVHTQTIRGWIKSGLRCLSVERPFLLLGCDLKAHVSTLNTTKQPLGLDELYCLGCRLATKPWGMAADYVPRAGGPGRLTGLCLNCERECHRFVSQHKIACVAPGLDVKFTTAHPSLDEPGAPA